MESKRKRRVWVDEYYNPNRYAINTAYFQKDILEELGKQLPPPYTLMEFFTLNDVLWLAIQALAAKLDYKIDVPYEENGHVDLEKAIRGKEA